MPIVDIRQNLPLYYEDTGTGTPILFIPPPGMGHVVFKYQKQHLSKDYRIISYDIRGQGNSGYDKEKLTIAQLAEDIYFLLEKIGIKEAVICGYSAGGHIAQHFAIHYPEKTKALILSGGYPQVSTFLLEKEYRIGMQIVKKNPTALAKFLAKSHKVTREDEQLLFEHMKKNNPDSWYRNYEESLHYKCTDQLHLLNMPVLLLYGQLSFYLKGYRKYFLEHIENVKVEFIKGAFHQLPIRKHEAFNKQVREFLHSL
jgi:pimeloyl-ACP methyl ester carboxylesterase